MPEDKLWSVVGIILSLTTIIIAVLVIVLEQMGLLPEKLITTSILAVVTLLATTEIVESRRKLSRMQEELKSVSRAQQELNISSHEIAANVGKVEAEFKSISIQLAAATRGVEARTFATYDEAHDYFARLTREATSSIHQASIDSLRSKQSSERNPARMKYEEARKTIILQDIIRYQYIGMLDKDIRRLEMSKEFIFNKELYNYLAGFYLKPNSKMPLISFTVFDKMEVFTRHPYELGADPKFMAIRSPQVAELFIDYFEKLWDDCIKVGTQEDYEKLKLEFEQRPRDT